MGREGNNGWISVHIGKFRISQLPVTDKLMEIFCDGLPCEMGPLIASVMKWFDRSIAGKRGRSERM